MQVNYILDNKGQTIAVQIPIDDWEKIINKYPGVYSIEEDLPQWQKT